MSIRIQWSVAVIGVVGFGTQAVAVNQPSQATLARRQVVSCMTHQMSVSRTISYNDAAKLCKDHVKSSNARLNASTLPRVASTR